MTYIIKQIQNGKKPKPIKKSFDYANKPYAAPVLKTKSNRTKQNQKIDNRLRAIYFSKLIKKKIIKCQSKKEITRRSANNLQTNDNWRV